MATDGKLAFYKENQFHNLAATGYTITSSQTASYNSARSTLTQGGVEGDVSPYAGGSGGLVPQHQPRLTP
jgi:hypothetical protein